MSTARARALLTKCEADLRSLLAIAANEGDYDAVLKLTSWARTVASLIGPSQTTPPDGSGEPKLPRRKKIDARSYPRFARRGDNLVKIGWSKKEKAEYEHKAPMSAVTALVAAIKKAGADGRIFQVGTLLPCQGDSGDVPDYQVYLIVAWLRAVGLLDQHGRQGYSVPNIAQFSSAVDHACNDLNEL